MFRQNLVFEIWTLLWTRILFCLSLSLYFIITIIIIIIIFWKTILAYCRTGTL